MEGLGWRQPEIGGGNPELPQVASGCLRLPPVASQVACHMRGCRFQKTHNKRCKAEIPPTHPLAAYSLTGAGLKNRTHPLATAVALNQVTSATDY